MSQLHRDTVIRIRGINGRWITIAGPDAGEEGYWLDVDPKEIFDAQAKVTYEEPGNWPGARYLSHRVLRRDMILPIIILDDDDESWAYRDSELRMMFDYNKDSLLEVTHPEWPTRTLKFRLGEQYEVDLKTDPNLGQVNVATIHAIAGDPFWYEEDAVFSAVTTTDTTFDPNPLPWPWPQEDLPYEDLTIHVPHANPTDQDGVYAKWTVPGSTLPPAEPYVPGIPWLGAPNSPAVIWTIPDYNLDTEGYPENGPADRRLRMPSLIGGLRTNEVQRVTIKGDAHPTGGYWTLDFDGEVTGHLAPDISAADLKTALEALPNLSVNDTQVTRGTPVNEVQEYVLTGGPTGGTYKLGFDGQWTPPIAPWLGPYDVQLALGLLPNLGFFDISVEATEVSNEVQTLSFTGEPSGGYFTLTLNGQTTGHLAYNCSPLDIMNALSALSNVGPFQILVTQDGIPFFNAFQPFRIIFSGGNVAGINQNQISVDASHLTGGAMVGMQVNTTTEGGTKYTIRFGGTQAGINVPQLTIDASDLSGGVSPGAAFVTDVQGEWPYIIEFQNLISGVDVPPLIADWSNLTGGSGVNIEVVTIRDGATAPAENAMIDSDPRVEQVVSESGSALWARMNGVRFKNHIPKWTKAIDYHVRVSGAVVGQMVTLRIPRPYSRPWGLKR